MSTREGGGREVHFLARAIRSPKLSATTLATIRLSSNTTFVASVDPLASGQWTQNRSGRVEGDPDVSRRLKENVVGTFTLTDLEQGLALFAAKGMTLPEGWMTRATVLVQLNPAYAQRLADLFERPGQNQRGRKLVLDILASAGSPEAQSAMRDALSSTAAHEEPGQFGAMLQRFSFVEHPTGETLTFLSELTKRGVSRDDRLAAAFSLGAAVGHDASHGGSGRSHAQVLVDGLRNAKTPEDRAAMVAALGNAALPENVEMLHEYASDPDPGVRAALGRAVRKNDEPESRRVLLDLAKDSDPSVAKTAISTLRAQSMDRDDLEQLESVASSTNFDHRALDGELVSVLETRPEDDPVRGRMLASILASTRDAKLAARVRMLDTKPEGAM